MDIGQKIKAIRSTKGLTQSQIAEQIGLDTSSYARIEKKGNKLSVGQLQSIAKILDVGVGELLGEGAKVESNEDFEWFEGRIKELEDRVKDKEALNKVALQNYEDLQLCVETYLESLIEEYAIKNRFGVVTIELVNSSDYQEVIEYLKDIPKDIEISKDNMEAYFFTKYLDYDVSVWNVEVDENQRKEAVKYIVQKNFFIHNLYSLQQLLDKDFKKEMQRIDYNIRKQQKRFFGKLSKGKD